MLDFDEILVSVKNPEVKKYLQESIKSYQIGNYRSAILAVWIAAMFDLVKKFEILVEQHEQTAIEKWRNLQPKIEEHKNWEKELIHAAKDSAMISRYEARTLESLILTRNRYAHPSFDDVGILFDPTPEEVRYFIRTLYDIVLSQPAQLGAFYVKELLEKIKTPTFFPTRLFPDELAQERKFVIEKISRINQKQIPRLIKDLFQALKTPEGGKHKLNILCLIVNLWDAQPELKLSVEISLYWDEHLRDQELNFTTLQALLTYPECINKLSEHSQQAIDEAFRDEFLRLNSSSESATRFIASADVVPLAQSLLEDVSQSLLEGASALITIDEVIKQSGHYAYLFGDKFTVIFGKEIFNKTRQALKTRNGYIVNPALSALRKCNIWGTVDSFSQQEQEIFANDLIESLNSYNWETMDLLNFDNRTDIPTKWINLLLKQWSKKIKKDPRVRQSLPIYLQQYLGLVERYEANIENYSGREEVVKVIIEIVTAANPHLPEQFSKQEASSALEKISALNSNKTLWIFWQKLLMDYRSLIASTPLEEML